MNKLNKILALSIMLCITLSMGCTEESTKSKHVDVMSIKIDDVGDGNDAIIIDDVYNYAITHTGSDFWGNKNYNVDIWYYTGSTECHTLYTEINTLEVLRRYKKLI